MNLIALDSSGQTAAVALVGDGILLGEYTINHKKTHSQTLMPMLQRLCSEVDFDPDTAGAVAVAAGPGSFTGLRIGASAAKGMAQALHIPILPVLTLEGLAYRFYGSESLVCPLMDARRGQVYSGIYRFVPEAGRFTMQIVEAQAAVPAQERIRQLNELGESVIFLGDGVPVHRETIAQNITVHYAFAPLHQNCQSAAAIAARALDMLEAGMEPVQAEAFAPEYLRPSQAERERAERLEGTA